MPGTPITDDGQLLGRLLLAAGVLVALAGLVVGAYLVLSNGFDVGDPFGPDADGEVGILLAGFAVAGGGVVASAGAMILKSTRRPTHHRSYTAYLDRDDDW